MCESQKEPATEGKSYAGGKIHDNNDGEVKSAALHKEGEVSLGELIWVKLHENSWWPALVVDESSVSESSKPGNRSHGEVLVRLYGSYEFLYADPMKYYSEFKMILEQNNGSCYEIFDNALEQDRCRRRSIKRSKSTANKKADAAKGKKKLNQSEGNQVDDSDADAIARKTRAAKADLGKDSKGNALGNKDNVRQSPRGKTSKQNEIQKKLKRESPTTAPRPKRGKTSKQGNEQKNVKPSNPSSDGIKCRTPKQNKLLKDDSNSQASERPSPGKSPKSSARRMRVMQGLGLAAPPGSPFHKN